MLWLLPLRWVCQDIGGHLAEHSDFNFAIYVLGIYGWELFVYPLLCLFEVCYVDHQQNFGFYVGVFNAVAPWLVAHYFVKDHCFNVSITVKGEWYAEGLM